MQVKYGELTALQIMQPITFEKGERIGVIGSNGAGKSTLIKALLELIPYEGRISTDVKPEQMAVHMQFNQYASTMAVKYIMEALLNTSIKKDKKLRELIDFFDFGQCLNKRFDVLSGGQKQKFTIIMVMYQEAELTFYDEVTSGLDFENRQRLMDKLTEWYRDKRDTLVVVSHYYEELEHLADKLLILDEGRVVAYGSREELFETYCGKVVYILDNNPKNREIASGFSTIKAPGHLIALSCRSLEAEQKLVSSLVEAGANFKRSNSDIEIMYINAKEKFYGRA